MHDSRITLTSVITIQIVKLILVKSSLLENTHKLKCSNSAKEMMNKHK